MSGGDTKEAHLVAWLCPLLGPKRHVSKRLLNRPTHLVRGFKEYLGRIRGFVKIRIECGIAAAS